MFASVELLDDFMYRFQSLYTTLPETNSSPLKIDPWKRRFLLETTIFRGYVMLVSGRVLPYSVDMVEYFFFGGGVIQLYHIFEKKNR